MALDFPNRRNLPHERPLWVGHGATWFLTLCCADRNRNQLCRSAVASVIFEALAFRQVRGDWYPSLCLLMPDHLHALVYFPPERVIRNVVEDWKRFIAWKTNVVWQRGFFDHRLRSPEEFRKKAEYIRFNPYRAGLVKDPDEWPYTWRPML